MSVREIMIKCHFLVTLVVSTGQTHNFGNLRPAIPWSPMYRLLIPYIKTSVREIMIKSHWAPGLHGLSGKWSVCPGANLHRRASVHLTLPTPWMFGL